MLTAALVLLVVVLAIVITEARWSRRMRGGVGPVVEQSRELRAASNTGRFRVERMRPVRRRPRNSRPPYAVTR